jgi:hypothetical protein
VAGIVTGAAPAGADGNCVAHIDPVQPGQQSSQVSQPQCFATFAEAIAAATGGTVHLSPTTKPSQLTQSMLSDEPDTSTVIGIDWVNSNFGGNSYTWTVGNGGCAVGVSFSVTPMPSGWNDVVSSAKSFANCNTYTHFENVGFTGSELNCGPKCATMGAMNDKTSSEKWFKG